MSDGFSDRTLVPGTIRGVRHWTIDSVGRLTGVSHKEIWKPEWNHRICRYDKTMSSLHKESPVPEKCMCGFYAFFNHKLSPYQKEPVIGIVEGAGTCVMGEKGFRAEKARILALVVPAKKQKTGRFARFWYKNEAGFAAFAGLSTVLTIAIGLILHFLLGPVGTLALIGLAPMLVYMVMSQVFPEHYPTVKKEAFEKVKRNYADIPFFDSIDDALKAFPVKYMDVEEPPERTPADPDFWTKP